MRWRYKPARRSEKRVSKMKQLTRLWPLVCFLNCMLFNAIFIAVLFTVPVFAGNQCIKPISAKASHETVWAGKSFTGPQEFAIDGTLKNEWTTDTLPATIEFVLSSNRELVGIFGLPAGSVSGVNVIDIIVDGKTIAGSYHNDGKPLFFGTPLVAGKITIRLLKEVDPITETELNWGGFAEFNVIAASAGPENCVSPLMIEAATNEPKPSVGDGFTIREIVSLIVDNINKVLGLFIVVTFVYLVIRYFERMLHIEGNIVTVVIFSLLSGVASTIMIGNLSVKGEPFSLTVQATGGFGVFVVILAFALLFRKPNTD
jgi:hypothetical protein